MSFRSHEGLYECTNFADFYQWITTFGANQKQCPNCGTEMDIRLYPTFNMNKYGRAIVTCPSRICQFNKDPIKIEATGGYPNGLEVFRTRQHPSN